MMIDCVQTELLAYLEMKSAENSGLSFLGINAMYSVCTM